MVKITKDCMNVTCPLHFFIAAPYLHPQKMPRSLLLILLLAACSEPQPQQIHLSNSSFEGTPAAGSTPDGWTNCGDRGESPTDIQPGFFGVSLPAAEGRTYLSMVVRETDKLEGLSQALPTPMKPRVEHSLWLSLAQSDSFSSPALNLEGKLKTANFSQPIVLRLYGGMKSCERRELLAQTPVIGHREWKPYLLKWQPSAAHTHLMLETFYDTTRVQSYNGHILVDHLSEISIK